ncbi:conserved exported hypothetical protein [Gammaproteobacteria bacterium]
MKPIILIILIFTSTCCLAISQKLIDGANKYDAAVKNLKEIENNLTAQGYFGLWSSDELRHFNPDHIEETDKQIHDLAVQYNIAKKIVKKLEPIKEKYNRQKEQEEYRAELLSDTGMLTLLLSMFALALWFIIRHHKKYQQLLKDGKITQKEYDSMMQCNKSSMFDNEETNPATGLRMIGGVDSGGNPRGCSFENRSTFDAHQDYQDRHRWD